MSEGVTGSDGGGGKLIRVGAFAILTADTEICEIGRVNRWA